MLKQKFCLWWIWYLLFDNAHFQRWLAWHRRRGTARITATMCR